MATSSLKKSFYITKKKEIEKFAEMLISQPKPFNEVKTKNYTQQTLKELINAEKQSSR